MAFLFRIRGGLPDVGFGPGFEPGRKPPPCRHPVHGPHLASRRCRGDPARPSREAEGVGVFIVQRYVHTSISHYPLMMHDASTRNRGLRSEISRLAPLNRFESVSHPPSIHTWSFQMISRTIITVRIPRQYSIYMSTGRGEVRARQGPTASYCQLPLAQYRQ